MVISSKSLFRIISNSNSIAARTKSDMSISRLHPLTRGGRGGVERVSPLSAPSTGLGVGRTDISD